MTLSTFLSMMAKSMNHPISLLSIILTQTLTICLVSSLMFFTPWFALVLFLIFLGGVMVLFIYMSSLASNENFTLSFYDLGFYIFSTSMLMVIATMYYSNPIVFINNKSLHFLELIYSIKFSPFFFSMILYLLFTLLVVSNMVKTNKSPMRSMK